MLFIVGSIQTVTVADTPDGSTTASVLNSEDRLRHWSNNKAALAQHLVFAGLVKKINDALRLCVCGT